MPLNPAQQVVSGLVAINAAVFLAMKVLPFQGFMVGFLQHIPLSIIGCDLPPDEDSANWMPWLARFSTCCMKFGPAAIVSIAFCCTVSHKLYF